MDTQTQRVFMKNTKNPPKTFPWFHLTAPTTRHLKFSFDLRRVLNAKLGVGTGSGGSQTVDGHLKKKVTGALRSPYFGAA